MTYKEALYKKAQEIPSSLGYGAPGLLPLQQQASTVKPVTSFNTSNKVTHGTGIPSDRAWSDYVANIAKHTGKYFIDNPGKSLRNGANGAANAFVWGLPRFLGNTYNFATDVVNLPANLYGLGNYALGGAGKPLYQLPKVDMDQLHSTWFGADPLSGQAGAVVGQLGLPVAAAGSTKWLDKGIGLAMDRKSVLSHPDAWKKAITSNMLARAKRLQRHAGLPHTAADFKNKKAYIKHLQQLRDSGKQIPWIYQHTGEKLVPRAYNRLAKQRGFKPIKQDYVSAFSYANSNPSMNLVPGNKKQNALYRDLLKQESDFERLNYIISGFKAAPKKKMHALRDVYRRVPVPNTSVGEQVASASRNGDLLLYKGWQGNYKPATLENQLYHSGPANSNRWLGGMPETSLSPSYSGRGGNLAIIQIPEKPSTIPRVRERFQPHMGANVQAGSPTEVYDAFRAKVDPKVNIGHYDIGMSPEYEFVALPNQWKKLPQLKHKVYSIGDYSGNDVSKFRRLSDPLPGRVANIPLVDWSKPIKYQRNSRYWNVPLWKHPLKEEGLAAIPSISSQQYSEL